MSSSSKSAICFTVTAEEHSTISMQGHLPGAMMRRRKAAAANPIASAAAAAAASPDMTVQVSSGQAADQLSELEKRAVRPLRRHAGVESIFYEL